MTTSRIIPEKWMYTDGNELVQADDIIKTARGWEKVHPNGQRELIHAFTSPGDLFEFMASVTNYADGIYPAGTAFSFVAVYGVAVDVVTTGGTPSINVYTDLGEEFTLEYASGTGTTDLTFTGTPTGIEGGTLYIREEIQLNGGTIKDANTIDVNNDFPSDYVQPTITITDVASVTNYADGTYDDTEVFSFTVVYSEAMDVDDTEGTPSMQIYTEVANKFDLEYASGTGTASLVFTGTPTGIADGSLVVVEDVVLNGGTIKNAAGSDAVSTFPTAYAQPTITMTTV